MVHGATDCHISTSPTRLYDGGVAIEIQYGSQISSGTGCGAADLPVDGSYTLRCFRSLLGRRDCRSHGNSVDGETSGTDVARECAHGEAHDDACGGVHCGDRHGCGTHCGGAQYGGADCGGGKHCGGAEGQSRDCTGGSCC